LPDNQLAINRPGEASMSAHQKVAVVTGASRGIGAGLVEAFLERNYLVVANSRSICPGASAQLLPVAGDVADPKTADRIVGGALEHFGRIDTLVNNAGVFLSKPFVDYSQADFEALVGINVAGFFHVSRRVMESMVRQGSGHIVTITTSLVDQPLLAVPSTLAALSKGGLNAATRSLAIEYAGRGIRVNAVSAGIIKTPMHPAETHGFFAPLHPMGRMGTIDEIVEAVLYLDTAQFVTGEILHVDGGQHAGHW
jgi:NAD(P)-dependent dehydrogenase (short-subunit alcohol dehydrogenase family)